MSRDPRLLPAPLRTAAALLAGFCAIVFGVLAVVYHGSRTAGRLDSRLFELLPRAQGRSPVWEVATAAPWVAVGVVVVVATALLLAGRWREAVFAAAAPGLTLLVAEGGKRVIDRTTEGFLALPSGHTAGITSVALTLAVLLVRRSRRHVALAAVLGWVAATLLGAAMGLVMVVLHSHYPTDTLAGYCAAVATTLGVAFATDLLPGYRGRLRSGSAGRYHHTEVSTSSAASASPSSSTNVETASSNGPLVPCRVATSPLTASSPIAATA